MKIRKIYISDDGEEFDSEEACLEHEDKINSFDSVLLFDSKKNLIKNENPEIAYERACYIYVRDTNRARTFLEWVHSECGYAVPSLVRAGELYFYDESTDKFKSYTSMVIDLDDTKNKILAQVRNVTK